MAQDTETVETEVEADVTGDISLSEMFDESEAEVSEVVETAETKAEDDQGEVEVKTEVAEPPAAEQGQLAAMLAERDKRKTAEAELRELKASLEPESTIDPIEDPEGYAGSIEKKVAADALRTKITLSQTMMSELDPDYQRLEGVFKGLIADEDGNILDEGLVRKFQQSDNPAKFARDHAKEYETVQAMKAPDYRDTLKAEVRAEVLAEIAKEAEKGVSVTDVPNLTKASAAGTNSEKVVPQPTIEGMFAQP